MKIIPPQFFFASLGGGIFNAAHILFVVAITIVGISVAFPVGMGLALVLGVLVNYATLPMGSSILLFSGVALIAIAILLNANAYRKMGNSGLVTTKGVVLSVSSGLLMGLFYKYVTNST